MIKVCYETGLFISDYPFSRVSLMLSDRERGRRALSNIGIYLSEQAREKISGIGIHASPEHSPSNLVWLLKDYKGPEKINPFYLDLKSSRRALPETFDGILKIINRTNKKNLRYNDFAACCLDEFSHLTRDEIKFMFSKLKLPKTMLERFRRVLEIKAQLSPIWVEEVPMNFSKSKESDFFYNRKAKWADEFFKKYEKPKLLN